MVIIEIKYAIKICIFNEKKTIIEKLTLRHRSPLTVMINEKSLFLISVHNRNLPKLRHHV